MTNGVNEAQRRALQAHKALLQTSSALDQMKAQVDLALGANPDDDQRRDLEAQKLEFAGRKAVVQERIALIEREGEMAPLPPPEAVAKTAGIVQRVELETAKTVRVDATISLTAEVFALANELTA